VPAPPCPEGSRETGSTCATKLAIAVAPEVIAPARDHHTTHIFEVGGKPYLYVFAGTRSWQVIHDDIQRAPIASDGSLGAFESAGTLPSKRAGHSTTRVKDTVIVVSGTNGHAPVTTSDVGTFGADGKIGQWKPGPTTPIGTMHHTAEVVGDYLYLFGGLGADTGQSVDQVVRAKLAPDGVPGAFESMAPLPEPRSHHMSFQYGGYLFLAGGLTGDPMDNPPSRKDIVRAKVGSDGSLGAWESAGTFPKGLSVSAAQVFARRVYFFGGLPDGSAYSRQVLSATLAEDGTLGAMETLSTRLAAPRAHVHQTPMFGRFIYSVGGRLDTDTSTDAIEIGTFSEP
jgi:hypothetical protein